MKWEVRKISWHSYVAFHDLIDNDGNYLGCVRGDTRPGHGFTPYTNDMADLAEFPTQSTLEEAKAMLVAHFAYKKLKGE
jgi:hypothetical protein